MKENNNLTIEKSINYKLREHIHEVYIILYEAILEDFMPNWKSIIEKRYLNDVNILIYSYRHNLRITKHGDYIDNLSTEDLYNFLKSFEFITKKIIFQLKEHTKHSILIDRFNLISKLDYKELNDIC